MPQPSNLPQCAPWALVTLQPFSRLRLQGVKIIPALQAIAVGLAIRFLAPIPEGITPQVTVTTHTCSPCLPGLVPLLLLLLLHLLMTMVVVVVAMMMMQQWLLLLLFFVFLFLYCRAGRSFLSLCPPSLV